MNPVITPPHYPDLVSTEPCFMFAPQDLLNFIYFVREEDKYLNHITPLQKILSKFLNVALKKIETIFKDTIKLDNKQIQKQPLVQEMIRLQFDKQLCNKVDWYFTYVLPIRKQVISAEWKENDDHLFSLQIQDNDVWNSFSEENLQEAIKTLPQGSLSKILKKAIEVNDFQICDTIINSLRFQEAQTIWASDIADLLSESIIQKRPKIAETIMQSQRYKNLLSQPPFIFKKAFQQACQYGNLNIVKAFIQSSASELAAISPEDYYSVGSALCMACIYGQWEIVQTIKESMLFQTIPAMGLFSIGAAVFFASMSWDSSKAISTLIQTELFKTIPPDNKYGLGSALMRACATEHTQNVVHMIMESELSLAIPADGPYSIAAAFYAACKGQIDNPLFEGKFYKRNYSEFNIFQEFLKQPYLQKLLTVSLESEYSIARAFCSLFQNECNKDIMVAFMQCELFEKVPANGKYSLATALIEASQNNNDNVKFALDIIKSSRFNEVNLESIQRVFYEASKTGVSPIVEQIIQSPRWKELSISGNYGIDDAFLMANANNKFEVIKAILNSNIYQNLPTEDPSSLYTKFLTASKEGLQQVVEALLELTVFYRIPSNKLEEAVSMAKNSYPETAKLIENYVHSWTYWFWSFFYWIQQVLFHC